MKTALERLDKVLGRVAMVANALGTLVVLGLVVVVNYDVVARGVFHKPFHGAVELVQFSMILIVFLQLPDVVRVNRLTRSDGFLSLAGRRWPSVFTLLNKFINLIAAVFMLLAALAIWPEFLEMWKTKDFFGVPGVFTAPWWPVKLVIFLSAALCFFLFSLKLFLPDTTSTSKSAHPDMSANVATSSSKDKDSNSAADKEVKAQ